MKIKFLIPLACLLLAGLLTGCVTPVYTVSAPPPSGPTLAEVQAMVQAHVSDSVIVNQIQNSSARYSLTADQIIALKNAGASDTVINALINTASKPPVQPTTVQQGTYVSPNVYVNPWWGWGGPYYYGGYYYRGGYYRGGYNHGGGGYYYHH